VFFPIIRCRYFDINSKEKEIQQIMEDALKISVVIMRCVCGLSFWPDKLC